MTGLKPDYWIKLLEKPLFIDQTGSLVEFKREDIELFYLPLAEVILKEANPESRLIVGVAGPPGSGKTVFATVLATVINITSGTESSVHAGLDGWHYPNDYLETHFAIINGETIPLKEIKGAPESFDSGAALNFLRRIRQNEAVQFPLYSREFHDPVPDMGIVKPSHRIVIFEGNYLFLDEGNWKNFFPLFDISIYIDVETDGLLEGLLERHLRGGKNPAFTEKHMRRVDLPNILRVKSGLQRAQITVHKADSRRIIHIDGLAIG